MVHRPTWVSSCCLANRRPPSDSDRYQRGAKTTRGSREAIEVNALFRSHDLYCYADQYCGKQIAGQLSQTMQAG